METKPIIAIFPGSFDPITRGHLDVIQRGSKLFDRLIVAVGQNPDKRELFSKSERVEMIRELVKTMPRVEVESFDCLTVEFAKMRKADVMLRGLRNLTDVEYEFQLAMTNRTVAGIETVFVMTSEEYGYINSSIVRQLALLGGDVSKLIPPLVFEKLNVKMRRMPRVPEFDVPES
ncbi:MAG: pantetheine-phosphate adenylyltransferase [Planctomycetaceae bacterium]|nr:pantetheine-phosphate adenylyltransferase [Planctomycetaceae bacterium]